MFLFALLFSAPPRLCGEYSAVNGLMHTEYVDLHSHSTASDGTLAPREVARLAKERGLALHMDGARFANAGCRMNSSF